MDHVDPGHYRLYENRDDHNRDEKRPWSSIDPYLLVANMQGHGDDTDTTKWPTGGECPRNGDGNKAGRMLP